ncbi:hypothetical protein BOW53_15455 [Solemya pervernicosa gill symbiont]|uniref:Uncharacterized protein n=2 Tax=Gammaproteobacteria incertae sedis TaxID=118884 RepID=A0A1T2L0J5_9GAMM|nr:hypothetical protein [Candidatus Reidiella endopervernicosa]OOZ38476.1 hypothetical protein BOW53_15455 [Solemya pervernicosa gill symbiont]QKQ28082.1 hypothetical protein HUE57_18665 [Candidatus Reidiella endopervernicosa]
MHIHQLPPVTSSVRHHQVQKIWVKDEAGREESYQFNNSNLDVLEGRQVSLISGKRSVQTYRFVNRNTGYYWRIKGNKTPGMMGRFFTRVFVSFFALLAALPVLNLFSMLFKLFGNFGKSDFRTNGVRLKVLTLVFVVLVAFAYLPTIKLIDNALFAEKFSWTFTAGTMESVGVNAARFATTSFGTMVLEALDDRGDFRGRYLGDFEAILKDRETMSRDAFYTKYDIRDRQVTLFDFSDSRKKDMEQQIVIWMMMFMLPLFVVGVLHNQVALSAEYRINDALDELSNRETSG